MIFCCVHIVRAMPTSEFVGAAHRSEIYFMDLDPADVSFRQNKNVILKCKIQREINVEHSKLYIEYC